MPVIETLQRKVMQSSRHGKLEHFYSLAQPGQKILDVGVSAEPPGARPQRNLFLKNYRFAADTYTGLGIQDLSDMPQKYPGKRFVTYDGSRFPFSNKEFDWVFSNAVIEHVGNESDQVAFIEEMQRVANNIFFTTPNKFFPVESHTQVFFLHWVDPVFYWYLKRYKPGFDMTNLYLFSRKRLLRVLKSSGLGDFRLKTNRLLGLPMTFTVTAVEG